ncbi:MAG: phosphoenolpyruvate mutase [Deltaproteobacteria bacterium]|nr:phosphoenolpyruvate mutase [Deltaproteobacteria bacterium]
MKKTTQLKKLLQSSELEFLMEAHNGLSAKIVEEAGFKGIWGSGLSISASLGLRDNNEASWTQVLEVAEYMSDATTLPILLDGDTGYGNFNNMRRLVKKLEQRGVAGVCIEDKVFPKTNSFIRGEKQPLAEIEEFSGKIKAGIDSRTDEDFCIIARIEAFIAGWGLEEALKRAQAYYEAGADAVLIHSKLSRPDQILDFARAWKNQCPIIIVPTKYYSTPTQVFRDHHISLIIWANHLMRSAITAMKTTAKKIHSTQSLLEVEDKIASVNEVFRLQNDEELRLAEKKYLKTDNADETKTIILAASRGKELGGLTEDKPKALVRINGRSPVERVMDFIRDQGVKDVSLVRGYKKEAFQFENITYYDNDLYETTDELYSLYLAQEKIEGYCIISYGDILFRKHILIQLLEEEGDLVIVVDADETRRTLNHEGDFVACSKPYSKKYDESVPLLKRIQFSKYTRDQDFHGEWIGLMKSTPAGSIEIVKAIKKLSQQETFNKLKMHHLFQELLKNQVDIRVLYTDGHWLDIDSLHDLRVGFSF